MGSSKLPSKLSDLRVLITRPQHQHASLCSAIEDNGGEAKHFPLFAIEAVSEPILVQQIKTKVENLDNYQLVIFISTNAVKFGALWINDYWQRFPLGVSVLAIGPSTARKVSIELNCAVVNSDAGASSEDILLLDELGDISGGKVAIVRGIGGRELLAERLRQRGAEVDYIEVYRRMPTQKSGEELADVLIQENINITSTPPPQTSQTSALDVKKKYMDVLGETALNYTSKDVQKFNPKGNIDTTSPNGQLPSGEVGMDQIMGLMKK